MCVTECDAHHDEFSRHTSHPLFRSFDSTGSALILVFHPAVYFLTTGRREILNRHGPALVSNNKTVPDFIFYIFLRSSELVRNGQDWFNNPTACRGNPNWWIHVSSVPKGNSFLKWSVQRKTIDTDFTKLVDFFLLRLIIWIGSDKQDRRVLPFFYSHSGSVFNWSTVNKRLSWYPCDVFLFKGFHHASIPPLWRSRQKTQ